MEGRSFLLKIDFENFAGGWVVSSKNFLQICLQKDEKSCEIMFKRCESSHQLFLEHLFQGIIDNNFGQVKCGIIQCNPPKTSTNNQK